MHVYLSIINQTWSNKTNTWYLNVTKQWIQHHGQQLHYIYWKQSARIICITIHPAAIYSLWVWVYKCINAHRCYILTSYIGCILHFIETLIILIHNVKRLIFTFTQNHTLYSTPLPPNTVCKSVLKEKILNYRRCQEVWPSYTEWLTSLTQKNNFTPVSLCSAERRSRKIADTLRAIHTRAWHW